MYKFHSIILLVIFITGCFPYIEKSQPKLKVSVFDKQGQFIDQAKVILQTSIKEGKTIYMYQTQDTEKGLAFFDKKLGSVDNSSMFATLCIFSVILGVKYAI